METLAMKDEPTITVIQVEQQAQVVNDPELGWGIPIRYIRELKTGPEITRETPDCTCAELEAAYIRERLRRPLEACRVKP